jgi:hypothetical protein
MTRTARPEIRSLDRTLTPDELDRAPELAILSALEATLELAAIALACAHPELRDPDSPNSHRPNPPGLAIANTLARRSRALQRALRTYRRAVELGPRPQELPHQDF